MGLDLPEEQRLDVLALSIDWSGFSTEEQLDVSTRVVEGESAEFWMDGTPGQRREGGFHGPGRRNPRGRAGRTGSATTGLKIATYEVLHADRARESGEFQLDLPSRPIPKRQKSGLDYYGRGGRLGAHSSVDPWQEGIPSVGS